MTKLMPTDIKEDVKRVLEGIPANAGVNPFVTAYQILERLPQNIKDQLISERGPAGKGGGYYYSTASVVSDAAEMLDDIEIMALATTNLQIFINNESVIQAGNQNVGLYRLKNRRTWEAWEDGYKYRIK